MVASVNTVPGTRVRAWGRMMALGWEMTLVCKVGISRGKKELPSWLAWEAVPPWIEGSREEADTAECPSMEGEGGLHGLAGGISR